MSVLAEIVARKRHDVAARAAQVSLAALRARAGRSPRSLRLALSRPGRRFICECKQASPSEGRLRTDFDPAAIAAIYAPIADAISVLTDEPFFGGQLAHLGAVRAVTELPILCKDFVLGPYQVVEARAHGADAVLLMLSVLDDETYRACAAEAAALGMDALTEVHDEAELERALALDAPIIGINNRDLKTLQIDLATTVKLAPRIGTGRVIVSESGIRGHADVNKLAPLVHGFLVGSHLMKSERLDLALRELVFGRIKICGLTSPEAARAAWAAGARYGGLIFAAESRRRVDAATAAQIRVSCPLPLVGVFVNQPESLIVELTEALALCAVQLHGEEPASMIDALRARLPPGCEIWRSFSVRPETTALPDSPADRLLLDTHSAAARGGTGQRFDWSLLARSPARDRLIVAGGIKPENVAEAEAAALGAFALDVSSGVESAPGVKDEHALRRLFAALRGEP